MRTVCNLRIGIVLSSSENLEGETSTKLHLAEGIGVCNLSSSGDTDTNAGIRLRKVGMVQNVERIRTNLQSDSLNQLERFAQTEIQIAPVWPDQYVSSHVAECTISRRHKCGGIEPLSDRWVCHGCTAYLVGKPREATVAPVRA
jgi:hypothetical protein